MKASLEESENAMKILASDYDGTLNYNGFDSQKLDAIARWRAAGNLFGLVSGRSADSLWELADRDGFGFDFMIANNGAVVLDRERHVLHAQRCDGDLVLPVLRAMFAWDCPSAYLTADHTSVIQPSEVASLPSIPWFYQISTFLETSQEALEISSLLRVRFGDRAAVLTEEVGELARVIARKYGDQSFKKDEKDNIGEELADVLWVLLCLANQTGVDLTEELLKSIEKKTKRDALRHIENPKLKT